MLNMDFTVPVLMKIDDLEWRSSPMPGVERKPLAREDAERGHATSIVRYAPGSVFRAHPHPLGEEILVLDGVFCDETGHYPAGTYFRNPPGSSHAPFSSEGCTLFVKLHQFSPLDNKQVVISSDTLKCLKYTQPYCLHEYQNERVYLLYAREGDDMSALFPDMVNGVEILVVDGLMSYEGDDLPALSWFRVPYVDFEQLVVSRDSLLWIKSGHF
ncbi:ChrR Cupin-like domain protein [Marinomonas gallaica]|uniref:ChrR Cupin-like domain protein n=1 Tax=Marinomonas gallaica TaxID=1806667 RepID=A0A1C3JLT9_9GAMM|nr:cupin domain-containing protein [Marinomonas gallaica]SBT16182.1 ChrR Cupin-like domain protein [Marinomonas gallaica]SBT21230.1 ChrR Cupin-like domain protein [Marinomonas gallaica]